MKCHCQSCGHEWTARSKTPLLCPACGNTRWNGDAIPVLELETLECLRCGYKWHPRGDKPPLHCPACFSTLWNKPRQRKRAEKNRAAQRTAPRKRKQQKPKYPYKQPPSSP